MRTGRSKTAILLIVGLMLVLTITAGVHSAPKVTLRFSDWHLTEDVWNKSLTEGLAEFKKRYPNIDVVAEPISYGEIVTKYTVESEAKRAPDVFHLHASMLHAFLEKGYALDLTPLIAKEPAGFLDAWYETPISLCSYKGKVYALPGDYMSMVLIYNTEMFKAAGLDPAKPPKTWDEFLAAAKALTGDTNGDGVVDQWGVGQIGGKQAGFELRFAPIVWGFGADFLTPDGKQSALNTPQALEAFKFWVELYTKHKVMPPGSTTANPQDVRTQMAHKQIGMKVGSGWTAPIVAGINPALKAFDVLAAAPLPSKGTPVTSAWLSAWVVSSSTKHPAEAWELMKFITSKEMEIKWFVDNRVLSGRKDVSGAAPEILNDKFGKVIASQLPYARFVPQIKEWPEIISVIGNAVEEAMTGIRTPEAALARAHEQVNAILARSK